MIVHTQALAALVATYLSTASLAIGQQFSLEPNFSRHTEIPVDRNLPTKIQLQSPVLAGRTGISDAANETSDELDEWPAALVLRQRNPGDPPAAHEQLVAPSHIGDPMDFPFWEPQLDVQRLSHDEIRQQVMAGMWNWTFRGSRSTYFQRGCSGRMIGSDQEMTFGGVAFLR